VKVTKKIKRKARQLFQLCRVNDSFDEVRVREIVERIAHSRNRGYLALLSEFQRWLRLARAEHTAEIDSATPLPADLRKTVAERLEKVYGPAIEIQFAEKPELIGGMRIKVGSDVYDGSVRAGLDKLENSF
jgi:F-type H+-transporting ATPase subunit delta